MTDDAIVPRKHRLDSFMQAIEQTIPTPSPARAVPLRYWWLKRLALAGVILLAAVWVLRWRVDVIAAERLNARVAAIQAKGEPILPRDFNVEPVPDEDNAAILLTEAAEKFVELNPDALGWRERSIDEFTALRGGKARPPRRVTVDDILADPALLDANLEKVEQHLRDNEESLRLLHEARLKPAADWGLRFDESIFDVKLPHVRRHRELTELACIAALVAHRKADDRAAIGHVQDVLACAEHVNALPHLLGGLMGVVMSSAAAQTLQEVLPTLQCEGTQAGLEVTSTELRAELEETIQSLLADEAIREGIVSGIQFERASCLDGAQMATKRGVYSPLFGDLSWTRKNLIRVVAFLYCPVYKLDGARMVDHLTADVRACRAQLFGGEIEPGSDMSWLRFDSVLDRRTVLLSAFWLPQFAGTFEKAARDLSKRRLAATAIAIRLYELDHGRRPESLDRLVPEYLASVPIDPFSETGEPVHYVPDGRQARLELKSQTPAPESDETVPRRRWSNRDRGVVFRLAPRLDTEASPTQPSSEERIDQRDDVEHEPGQSDGDDGDDE